MGRPVALCLTAGQAHDLAGADLLLDSIKAPFLIADKAYNAKERLTRKLQAKNCQPVIPPKLSYRQLHHYDKSLYRYRHRIENFFAKLKQYRAIATRYDKTAISFLGATYCVASLSWLNF